MQGNASRRMAGGAESGPRRQPAGIGKAMAGLALCLMAAGCGSIGQALGPSAQAGNARDFSVAIESIDGVPRDVSQRLSHDLDEAAAALRVALVPAGGQATYLMRGYLAAHAQGSTTSIAWAFDVYDAELHRAVRLSGEEQAGKDAGRNWAMADEALLRRIAHTGMEQLAVFVASAPAPAAPVAPSPGRAGSAVAGRDAWPTAPAGVFRADTTVASVAPAAVPPPQRRPLWAGLTGTARLADATSGR
jgi:hypothetical protein